LVERLTDNQEVVSSNLTGPTRNLYNPLKEILSMAIKLLEKLGLVRKASSSKKSTTKSSRRIGAKRRTVRSAKKTRRR